MPIQPSTTHIHARAMSIFKRRIPNEMIKMINPTSKASLKTQCLLIANGKVEEAEKIYNFYVKDMEDMPMYDVPKPTWIDSTKETVNGILSIFGEHRDGLAQGYEIIRTIANARGANLPPLGASQVVESVPSPLPPINE